MEKIELATSSLRELNERLQQQNQTTNEKQWEVVNPKGAHAIAVGLNSPLDLLIKGSTGYYCAGMNQHAHIRVQGSVGPTEP